MRVGLLTQWYDPEPGPAALPGVLARGLLDRGHEVSVVTGFPNYPSGNFTHGYRVRRKSEERQEGVSVRRVALYPAHDASPIRRFANYASFGVSATASGLSALRDVDVIWVNYSPITIALPMWAARYIWDIPVLLHVLDLWPDTVLASGFARGGRAFRAAEHGMHAWCNAMYRSAASVAYISPGAGDVLERRGVDVDKLCYLPMWADESVFRPSTIDLRAELGIEDDVIVLLYAGALGGAQGLSTLVEACTTVDEPRFRCLIVGSGVARSSLRSLARQLAATNVEFLDPIPQEQMTALMATADLSYVSLRPHPLSPITMPSKIQAALAAGTALLVAAPGDSAKVVEESGAGLTADPADRESIARAIRSACVLGRDELRIMGAKGRAYYDRNFSVEQGIPRIEMLLEQIVSTRESN
jgi:colanic acid biosynthesis glycosyl transferase WcaI